jgi:hypothetical protein
MNALELVSLLFMFGADRQNDICHAHISLTILFRCWDRSHLRLLRRVPPTLFGENVEAILQHLQLSPLLCRH